MQQQEIGIRISTARKKLNYTQRELADRLGVSDKTISKWERGNGYPDISMLSSICKELKIDLSTLLGEAQQETTKEESNLKTLADYAVLMVKKHRENIRKLSWCFLSVAMLLGMMICLICDYAMNDGFSWSIISSSAIVYAWLVVTTALMSTKRIIEKTLVVIMLAIFPFLYIISTQISYPKLLQTSWIIALGADGLLLICYGILKKGSYSIWYKGALIVLFSGMFNVFVHFLVNQTTNMLALQVMGNVALLLALLCVGMYMNRRNHTC